MNSNTLDELISSLQTALGAALKLKMGLGAKSDQPAKPVCVHMTRNGNRCRNKVIDTIDGQDYCRTHRPKPPSEPEPVAAAVVDDGPTATLMNADEAAELLGLHRTSVYTAAQNGEIPCRRVGRRYLFVRETLLAWLHKQ